MANEYIFAIGAHVLYWGSKDLCNFIVKHVGRDALPEEEQAWRAMMRANGLLAAASSSSSTEPSPVKQPAAPPSRRGSSVPSASASTSVVAAAGEGEGKKGGASSGEIPEAVKMVSMAS